MDGDGDGDGFFVSAEDRPAKRRKRGLDQGKYVVELLWDDHWRGSGGGEGVQLVTDTAPSVRVLFTQLLDALCQFEESSLLVAMYVLA